MAIRYDSQLKAEIRRTVKSFNAKIRRLEAKGVTSALLPDAVSSKEIQQGITNRRELRKRLQQLQEFSSAGTATESEGGLIGTDILFQYRQGEANRAIRELRKEYQQTQQVDTRYPMMLGEYGNNLRAKMDYLSRDIRKMDVRQVQIFNKNILLPEQKIIKEEQFYKNFEKMLFYNAYRGELDLSFIENIRQLTPQQLLELYRTNPAFKIIVEGYLRFRQETGEDVDDDLQEAYKAANEAVKEKIQSK